MSDVIKSWVEEHDELSLDGSTILHGDTRLGSFRNDRCSIGPEDGGVRGDIVKVDDDGWLIVEGERTYWDDGLGRMNGCFAVRPWQPRNPEIDGPVPRESV